MDVLIKLMLSGMMFSGTEYIPEPNNIQMVTLVESKETEDTIIGQQEIEEYIVHSICKEMSPYIFTKEAMKAQAILIRTYVLAENNRHPNNAKCKTTHCQAYLEDLNSFKPEMVQIAREAVQETKGQVLYHNGELVKNPLFFAHASGMTNEPVDVWGGKGYPYLKSVYTPEVKEHQEIVLTKEDFLNKLGIEKIEDFEILERAETNIIKKVRLGDRTINGNEIRSLLETKSSNLEITFNGDDTVTIIAKGYGHGVGMSQYGADEFAKQGKSYREIIDHYFQDTYIVENYGLEPIAVRQINTMWGLE